MKTVKPMSTGMFNSAFFRTRIFLWGCFFIMVTGYASEKVNATDQTEIKKDTDFTSRLTESLKFTKKFNSLVSRAYFKLLVEAERADIRLVNEYKRLYAKNGAKMDDLAIQEEFTLVYKRFLTHRRMLSGLKSWRIFSEDRTGDLEYFKKEYRDAVYTMYQDKASDETIVAFLMYRLADLYHLP